jgi:hypothetical protein
LQVHFMMVISVCQSMKLPRPYLKICLGDSLSVIYTACSFGWLLVAGADLF